MRMWSKLSFHILWNNTTLENDLVLFYKVKHTDLLYDSPIPLPGKTYPQLYKNVNSFFIHNISKPETTQMFINRWMNKWILVSSSSGILISSEKEQMTDSYMIKFKNRLSKRVQRQKSTHLIAFIWSSGIGKTTLSLRSQK